MKHKQQVSYPSTEVVILAGGQARRMNGINKLLQRFDDQIQLLKLHQCFKSRVANVWINSHRDHGIYRMLLPYTPSFRDDEAGFQGPLMGMKSAWSHVNADYVLFVPCNVAYVPPKVLSRLHRALARHPMAKAAFVELNGVALYPFCLLHRSSLPILQQHLQTQPANLMQCFADLHAQATPFQNRALFLHSINSLDELQQHQQLSYLPKSCLD
jgi:molybdenum cofactor guanylyltransferase